MLKYIIRKNVHKYIIEHLCSLYLLNSINFEAQSTRGLEFIVS